MMRCLNHPAIPGTDDQRLAAFARIVAQAVAELIRQGFSPISFSADVVAPGLPSILVASSNKTAAAVEKERAAYYKTSTLRGVPERWGQLLYPPPGVRVIWVERGH
jgi:hypothetical protein